MSSGAEVWERCIRTCNDERYTALLEKLRNGAYWPVRFRTAECPLFFEARTARLLESVAADVMLQIDTENFRKHAQHAVPSELHVPCETPFPHFVTIDVALTGDGHGGLSAQVIELQGFPTLLCFAVLLQGAYRSTFELEIPSDYSPFFHGLNLEQYINALRTAIVGTCDPRNVVLLEVRPEQQSTCCDFAMTHQLLGVRPLCVSRVIKRGRHLYYKEEGSIDGSTEELIRIERIFSRVLLEELVSMHELQPGFSMLHDEVDVQWAGHPNWYYLISKHTLPLLYKSIFSPECYFVSDVLQSRLLTHENLAVNFVCKPLFLSGGRNVDMAPTLGKLELLREPSRWILQRKVAYKSVATAPMSRCIRAEVRLLLVGDGASMPRLVGNLVRFNQGGLHGLHSITKEDKWCGGSICFFAPGNKL